MAQLKIEVKIMGFLHRKPLYSCKTLNMLLAVISWQLSPVNISLFVALAVNWRSRGICAV